MKKELKWGWGFVEAKDSSSSSMPAPRHEQTVHQEDKTVKPCPRTLAQRMDTKTSNLIKAPIMLKTS